MKKISLVLSCIVALLLVLIISCNKKEFARLTQNESMMSGGMQTVFDEGSGSYTHAFAKLTPSQQRVHEIGDMQFEKTFVTAPSPINSGLGPLYNNVSCVSCHVGDGRGKVPGSGETAASILFRISSSGVNAHGAPQAVNNFGDQIQHRSVNGVANEAQVSITYNEANGVYYDGTPYSLRSPTYTIIQPYIPLPSGIFLSPRVASPVFGLGLLEAISELELLAMQDESDANKDGISGKANYVWDVFQQKKVIGRFGWKANQPSLLQQVAAAYNGDMGVTNFLFPNENCKGQLQDDLLQDDVELSDSLLYATTFYVRTLAVPARRNVTDANVIAGEKLFIQANCQGCHVATLHTKVDVAFAAISGQTIHPYTDLLLHDMGDALADKRPDYAANGNEWRTPPLWGIGLTQKVNGHSNFLHDGRARNLMEAILWHGGEAQKSYNAVIKMNTNERQQLIRFLASL